MLFSFSVLIVLLSIHTMETVPVANPTLTQGDMRLTEAQRNLLTNGKPKKQANVSNNKWPDQTVYYRFKGKYQNSEKKLILKAMFEISLETCIHFKRVTKLSEYEKPHLEIKNTEFGCWSDVGYLGKTQQLNLDTNCFQLGYIIHELLHTLGFYHQQSASDRDEYVKIYYENIIKNEEHNFNKYANGSADHYGVGYDYASIMHYGATDFSKDGTSPTIEVLQTTAIKIGQRDSLSPKDILKLNKAYGCNPAEDVAKPICMDAEDYQKN